MNISRCGDTQDSTWYDANLSTDITVMRNLSMVPNEWVTLGPLAFDRMNTMSSTMPINWIIGLNFNVSSVENPENVLAMAIAAESSIGENIYAFEIGNEPDNFVTVKQRPPGWNMADYVQEWAPLALKLQQAVPSTKHQGIEAAVFGGGGWRIPDLLNYDINGSTFIDLFQSSTKGVSKHQYQTSNCNLLNPPVLQDLLNHSSIENKVKYAVSGLSSDDLAKYSFRLGEFNSVSCEGRSGVSNSFASALWAIDYMMLLAYYNVTACNIHNRFPSYYNIADRVGGVWKAQPVWYSLLFIAQTFGGMKGNGVSVTSLATGDPDMPAYGLYNQAILTSIVVINLKQPSSEYQDQNITLIIDTSKSQYSTQPLYLSSLVTKTVESQTVIRWANQTMDGSINVRPSPIRSLYQHSQHICWSIGNLLSKRALLLVLLGFPETSIL
ncbi:hypothetical protein INT44_003538 [Umbelopsis vinacea]|uniref:Glycoside hydrolase family 79 protein n=1 Tax=Umbelopsis vinacea TaxID=44442 RepID=A0A8H7UIQ9_9FUNG|nr:hypothetical protein INT44_003538 [Umbelopsis vinacea]